MHTDISDKRYSDVLLIAQQISRPVAIARWGDRIMLVVE